MTRPMVFCCLFACLLCVSSTGGTAPQDSPAGIAGEDSPEEQRERQIHERFVELLKRSPRFGTALDRVYGYHVERGTLDTFVDGLREQAKRQDTDGTEWMLVGLFEYQRGNDGPAVEAFRKAEGIRDDDPLSSYYLGRAYLLLGDEQKAAEAYERALQREPRRIDLMEIFQGLGRLYQRANNREKASEIWDRLEKLFPDDAQVLEEIAYITAEEGDHEGALKRYQKLAGQTTEPYGRVQYDMQAGKMLIRLDRSDEAITLFEETLKRLKPDSWLHRDVRRQIEDVFLATEDYNGLTIYYEKWLATHDDDVEAMGRLAQILAMQGRLPESQQWYARAIKLAPSNTDLRESLIARLIDAARYEQAIEQYEQLDKIDPGNADYIEKWGQLVFENPQGDKTQKRAAAAKIWDKMLTGHEEDPVLVTRVADLLRYAELSDDAVKLYRKAIELAPENSQYREYLGEYYHILKRTRDAKDTWEQIAAGPRRNRENLVRLAEVYSGFGFDEDALRVMREACDLDPEFADRLQFAVMLTEAEDFDEAHRQLDLALKIAETDEERDHILQQRIDAFLAANRMQEEIDKLRARLQGPDADSADAWLRMAIYQQAISEVDPAVSAIERSLALDANSVRTLTVAAALYESVGRLDVSVETYRKLSNLDRQFRSEYLQKIASLEMRLGRTDKALTAGEDLIASAPGNPENYSFYAELCFRLGKTDQGLDSLRRAVRTNPSDPAALLTLAQALSNQFRTADAIELYWQAFDKSEVLDDKLNVISTLTELYLRTGHFDRLIEKLEFKQRQGAQNRDITICAAAAYKNLGDFVKSREILEQLLTEDSRDVGLLQELARLSSSANEYDDAVRYQRRILELAPTTENEVQLAQILLQSGDLEEAEALWTKLVTAEQEEHRVFRSLDRMIQLGKTETALAILEKLLRDDPDNWEALFRKGIALWKRGKQDDAMAAFDKLVALQLDDSELSSAAKNQEEQRKLQLGTGGSSYAGTLPYPPEVARVRAYPYAQQMLSNNTRASQTNWSPDDYGQARVASMAVGFLNAQRNSAEYVANLNATIEKEAKRNPRKLWDLYYLQYATSRSETRYVDQYLLGKRLSQAIDDDAAKYVYLSSLRLRNYRQGMNSATSQLDATPLEDEEITHMLNCFEQLYRSQPDWLNSGTIVHAVTTELRIAGKEKRADELYQQLVLEAGDEKSLGTAIQMAATAGNIDEVIELGRAGDEKFGNSGSSSYFENYRNRAFLGLLQQLLADNRHAEVDRLLFAQLEHQKRRYLSLPVYRRSRVQQTTIPMRVSLPSTNNRRRTETITYPTPNPFFDSADIIFAYTTFDGFKRYAQPAALSEALAAKADSDSDLDEVVARLALAYVKWWSKDETAALREIETAAKLYPNEPFLQLQLTDSYYRSKRYKEALAVVNDMQAPDRTLLEQRETMALQLAVQVGDLDRAREAAQRLFGMNLKTDMQIQLASQMNQLGMHELADAVLARTRRRAGNQSSTLIQLMQQYAAKGNNDVANQIAMQIIRRSSPPSTSAVLPSGTRVATTSTSSAQRAEAAYRKTAIQQLNRTGELDKVIARLEEQLKTSPDSKRLNETLLDYYQSAGRTSEANEILRKLRTNLPANPAILIAQARKLYSSRDYNGACELYLRAIELQPDLIGNEFYNIQRAFEQANRDDDLVKMYLAVDMSKIQNQYFRIGETVNRLAQKDNGKRVDDAVKIFQRAWDAMPSYRENLLASLTVPQLWLHDDIYGYAREVLIPGETAKLKDSWMGLADINYAMNNDGSITGVLTHAMNGIVNSEKRKQQFIKEVTAARKQHSKWHAGAVFLALIDARAGETDKAHEIITSLFEKQANLPSRAGVSWMIASELSRIEGMEPTALNVLESIDMEAIRSQFSSNLMNYEPRRLMVTLHQKTGERRKARQILYALLNEHDYSQHNQSNPGYSEYQKLRDIDTASGLFIQMNYIMDAIRLLEENLADDAQFSAASRWGGSNYKQRWQSTLLKARKMLTPQLLRESLVDWLPAPDTEEYRGINLIISVEPESVESATLISLFEQSLLTLYGNELPGVPGSAQKAAEPPARGKPAGPDSVATIARLQRQLEELKSRRPEVLTYPAIEALLLLPDADRIPEQKAAIANLVALAEQHQESLGQQETASEQLAAVWLVARQALQSPEHRAAGEKLAELVIDSSAQIQDPAWVTAILRERGQLALDAGDRQAAEKYWSLLLTHILTHEIPMARQSSSIQFQAVPPNRSFVIPNF